MTAASLSPFVPVDNPVLATALRLAAGGIPVFPQNPDKSPACARGFNAASCDREVVWRLFSRAHRADRIGMPTGMPSGITAIDVDPDGMSWLWTQDARARIPVTRIHSTPRGGRHLFFVYSPGLRGSNGKLAPGVEIKGEANCITIWGPGYEVVNSAPVTPFPVWMLREFARIDRVREQRAEKRRQEALRSDGNGVQASERILGWLRGVARGSRNQALFWAACRAGEAGGDGTALIAAGLALGLPLIEVRKTVESGLATGRRR